MAPSRDTKDVPGTNIFKGKVFVLCGNFKEGKDGKLWTHPSIARMIRKHGGKVDQFVSHRTTHCVTTLDEFKNRTMNIQRAIARKRGRTRIVVWEYIEDSLFPKSGVPRHVSASFHEVETVLRRERRFKEARDVYNYKYRSYGENSAIMVDKGLNHMYKDDTGFEYNIVLSRPIQREDGKKLFERFRLMMFESNAAPYTYMVGIKYNRPGKATSYVRDFLSPAEFFKAFGHWKKFFKTKTGISWDKRLNGIVVESLEHPDGQDRLEATGTDATIATDKIPFIYIPPPRDQPRGQMPITWRDPEVEAERKAAEKKRQIEEKRRIADAKRQEEEMERLKVYQKELETIARMMKEDQPYTGSDGEQPMDFDDDETMTESDSDGVSG